MTRLKYALRKEELMAVPDWVDRTTKLARLHKFRPEIPGGFKTVNFLGTVPKRGESDH